MVGFSLTWPDLTGTVRLIVFEQMRNTKVGVEHQPVEIFYFVVVVQVGRTPLATFSYSNPPFQMNVYWVSYIFMGALQGCRSNNQDSNGKYPSFFFFRGSNE